ncbi:hypothetical protein V8F33_008217 [Rhypophila sp. PSN 637]
MAPSPTVNDKGITVLFEPLNPTIDIVFVHGFTGHPERTWTLKDSKHSQPGSQRADQNGAPCRDETSNGPKRPRSDSFVFVYFDCSSMVKNPSTVKYFLRWFRPPAFLLRAPWNHNHGVCPPYHPCTVRFAEGP